MPFWRLGVEFLQGALANVDTCQHRSLDFHQHIPWSSFDALPDLFNRIDATTTNTTTLPSAIHCTRSLYLRCMYSMSISFSFREYIYVSLLCMIVIWLCMNTRDHGAPRGCFSVLLRTRMMCRGWGMTETNPHEPECLTHCWGRCFSQYTHHRFTPQYFLIVALSLRMGSIGMRVPQRWNCGHAAAFLQLAFYMKGSKVKDGKGLYWLIWLFASMPSMTPKMDFRFQSTRCYYGRWDSPGMCRHPNHRDREWWSIKNKAFLIMCRSAPLPERTRCPSIQTWARLKMRNSRTSHPQCIRECAVLIQAKSCTHVVKRC